MAKFATETTVSVENSLAEIRRTITRYGAVSFAQFDEVGRSAIAFEMRDRRVRFVLNLPDRNSREFQFTPARRNRRTDAEAYKAWEQACRQRWRALLLAVKSKLETVECGIETFDQAFMAHIVLPNGKTIGEAYIPQLPQIMSSRATPPLLMLEGPAH